MGVPVARSTMKAKIEAPLIPFTTVESLSAFAAAVFMDVVDLASYTLPGGCVFYSNTWM